MKIECVTAHHLRLDRVRSVFDGTQDVLVVEVTTDSGLTGLGEVVSASYVAKSIIEAPRSGAGRHGLAEVLVGLNARDVEAARRRMFEQTVWFGRRGVAIHAMSGVEMALWDLRGKAESTPAYRLLAGSKLSTPAPIKAYASVLWDDVLEDTVHGAQALLEQGFLALKFGFGRFGLGTVAEDAETLSTLRTALGEDVELMVDVGRKWSVDRAIEGCSALADFGLTWIEEPLDPDDLEGYNRLCGTSPVAIAGAETEETIEQFDRYLDAGLSVIQPDLGRCGPGTGMELSRITRERGRRCVPHCFGTGINTAAAIHWMAATGGDLVEYPMGDSLLRRDLVAGVPSLKDGYVKPSERPGWGVDIDTKILEKHKASLA